MFRIDSYFAAAPAIRRDSLRMSDFEGEYRTPRGLTLKVTAHAGFVTLREPSGLELRIEPIGTDLFESDYVSPDGSITRYSFNRNERAAWSQ